MNTLKMIDRYAILGKIGQGGMSTVYRAFDPETQEDVAIKVLRETLRDDDELRGRFSQEAKLLSELRHPAIIPLLDYGEVNGRLYFVMPYMESGSLKDWLEEGIPPFAKTVAIMTQIAAGLDKAHSRDIIHRDIKPHNIMLEEDGKAYLSDFGVARLIDHDRPEQTMTLIGTPEYMAPEQVLEGKLTCQTDIYQLGVVLFQMLTGERPFEGPVHTIMSQHLNAPIPSVEARNPKLPQGCDAIVKKAMAKKAINRFESATAVAQALQSYAHRKPAKQRVSLPPLPDLVPLANAKANTVLRNGRLPNTKQSSKQTTTKPNPFTPLPRPKRKAGKVAGMLGVGAAIVGLGFFAMGGIPVGAPNGGGNNNLLPPALTIDQNDENGNGQQNGRRGGNNGNNDNNRNDGGNNGGRNNGRGGDNAALPDEETAVAEVGVPPVMNEEELNTLLADTPTVAVTLAETAAPPTEERALQTGASAAEFDAILNETAAENGTQNSFAAPAETPTTQIENEGQNGRRGNGDGERDGQRDGNGRSPRNEPRPNDGNDNNRDGNNNDGRSGSRNGNGGRNGNSGRNGGGGNG